MIPLVAGLIYTHFLLHCPDAAAFRAARVRCHAHGVRYACGVRPTACWLEPRVAGGGETASPAWSF